jgi:hypothetical protein
VAVSFFRLFSAIALNERMSEPTAEVCQTQQAVDLKHQGKKEK